ncbi:SDR family NAD(P)-dependent oxidoreductase [Mesorhizobium erdmanii]|uniref:SDR family NAD(P)-dependent oxidoreductase n=1 Tax=Mesorhizobium erdmanii TaxID=1777866 RepID=UPI001FCBEE0F|nr:MULTISPECIES: SDR family NAD(P)-dependent oxidoreductase [Mesorhizobium]
MRLAGKVAIVTGVGSGFGEGIVRKFVTEGALVVLMDRDGAADSRVACPENLGHCVLRFQ